jgi:hypothetical protein
MTRWCTRPLQMQGLNQLEGLLTCQICAELFRTATMLPCSHNCEFFPSYSFRQLRSGPRTSPVSGTRPSFKLHPESDNCSQAWARSVGHREHRVLGVAFVVSCNARASEGLRSDQPLPNPLGGGRTLPLTTTCTITPSTIGNVNPNPNCNCNPNPNCNGNGNHDTDNDNTDDADNRLTLQFVPSVSAATLPIRSRRNGLGATAPSATPRHPSTVGHQWSLNC